MSAVRSPTSATRSRIVSTVKAAGSTSATSSQRSGADTRASEVGRTEYAVAIVRSRVFWPKSTKTPRRSATRQVVVATSWSPTRRSTSSASAFAKRRTSGKSSSGLIGAMMCSPVAPEVFGIRGEAELVHHLAHDERDLADVRPLAVGRRVEIDQQVVRPLDVVDPRVPRVQLDAAEVDDPRQRRRVVDHREDRRVAARELDVLLADVIRVRRHPLLVKELPVHAVRVAHHVEGPAPQVRERSVGEVDVVLDEVALRQAGLGEEDLVRVRY